VRFAQNFGYSGFRELQTIFQARLAIAAPGFESRIAALKTELALHRQGGAKGPLADLVARDIASLQDLLEQTSSDSIQKAVALLRGAETIYIAGQLRSAPIAVFLRYVLTMLGRRAVLLEASGGLATEMAKMMRKGDLLVAIAFKFYAKEVVSITERAAADGVPILAISDSRLSPLAKTATVLFEVPEDEYTFSRSLAAPMCLAQSLLISLAAELQEADGSDARIPILTQPA
jgi:DNA-binding MurR/RpiR family transcriptional regulator